MAIKSDRKLESRRRRQARVRRHILGTAQRPRLNVFRSAKHIYAQVIDDDAGVTLAAAASVQKAVAAKAADGKKADAARAVGSAIAAACQAKQIAAVVFDRNGFRYHGRVRAVADAAREAGLTF